MRTLHRLLVLPAVLFLAVSFPSFGSDFVIDSEVTDAIVATEANPVHLSPSAGDATRDLESSAAVDLGPMVELLDMKWAEPQPMGFFGSHCSGPPSPWTCTIVEPGLGCPPGGECTYTCQCDRCLMNDGRTETVAINCQVVDNGGCLACPM